MLSTSSSYPKVLITRAHNGYQAAIRIATGVPQLPEGLRAIPFVGLTWPDPPQAWLHSVGEPPDATGGPFAPPPAPILIPEHLQFI